MSPADVPQGLQSTTNLTGGSAVSLPTAFQSSKDVYKVSIEDWKQIFGQNIVPQHASKNLLQLMWLVLNRQSSSMLNTFYLFSISITQPLPGFWSTPP